VYSEEDALNQFKALFIRKNLDFSKIKNPFPVSLAIELKRITPFKEIKNLVTKINAIDKSREVIDFIDYGSEWLENALTAFRTIKKFGIIFLAILFSGLFMPVFNTCRLIFISRNRDLGVMKMMGATNYFIAVPYLIEALLTGLISSAASLTILYSFWIYLDRELSKISFLFSGYHFFNAVEIASFALTGTFLVAVCAFLSIQNFLRDIR